MSHEHSMQGTTVTQPGNSPGSCCHRRNRRDWLLITVVTVVLSSYGGWFFAGDVLHDIPYAGIFVHSVAEFVNTVWWGIALGIVAVAALNRMPREWVVAVLGKPGTSGGIFRAVLAGLLLDLCSHGILLVGMKLYERGASIGQTYAFLIASPWNSLSMTLILWALIGLPWTLAFIALSMVIALIAGLLANSLERRGVFPKNPNQFDIPADFRLLPEIRSSLRNVRFSFWGVLRSLVTATYESGMIIRWMFLGIIIAAALRTLFSPEAFSMLFGPSILGLGATLLFATILEVCSEGSSPVAADFLLRAAAPGNAFAFLMTGVATDYTEILSLKDTTKSWKLAFFLPLLTVPQVVVIAVMLNQWGV